MEEPRSIDHQDQEQSEEITSCDNVCIVRLAGFDGLADGVCRSNDYEEEEYEIEDGKRQRVEHSEYSREGHWRFIVFETQPEGCGFRQRRFSS